MTKQEIRMEMKARRAAVPEDGRAAAELSVLDRLQVCGALDGIREICLYESFGSELGTSRMKSALFSHHYLVSVPVTGSEIRPVRVTETTRYGIGAFGIRTPEPPFELVRPEAVIVPALAFDRRGYRVGFGKGYYDRFLKDLPAVRIGVCFDFQLLEEVPCEPHDLPMDYIVTDRRVLRLSGKIGDTE